MLPSLSHLILDTCILVGAPILPTSESSREQQDTRMTGKGRDALTDHQLRSIDLQSYIIAVGSLDRNKRLREPQL